MLSHIQAIIFDHDGTLVDSEPVHFNCWNQVLSRYNASFEFNDYATHLNGVASIESAKWLIRHCGLALTPEALYAQKQAQLELFLAANAYPLMSGALELVAYAASAGYALAVASGAGRFEIDHSLRAHGLDAHLRITATKNDVVNNKPAPDVYLLAAAQLGVAPERALAIEDSDAGQAAALAAGMTCFRLGHGSQFHPRVKMFSSLEAIHQELKAAAPQR